MTSQNARTGAIRNYDNSLATKGPSINYVVLVGRGVGPRTIYYMYIDLT